MRKIAITPDLTKLLIDFRLGIIEVNNINCKNSSADLIAEINRTVAAISLKYKLDEIKKIPAIASTRIAYKALGNDPNRYRPSAESLMRRIVKGMGIYHVNNIVDCLNLTSILSGYSIGSFDIDKIEGAIELGIGSKKEPYNGIGRGFLNIEHLPVLRDNLRAFGSPTSDSERTIITNETRSVLFVFYDFANHHSLPETLNITENILIKFCNINKEDIELSIQNTFQ